MPQRKLVIWGASGQGRVVADIVRLRGEYELVGFLDDLNPERAGTDFCEAPILGGREQLDVLRDRGVGAFLLGFGNSAMRLTLAELVRCKGFELATAFHPHAVIAAGVPIGDGTVVRAGAVIDPGVTLGQNVIVGPGACVGHDSTLADGVRISVGASIAGTVSIGRASMIGAGAAIRNGVRIGEHVLVGAGAAVVRDIPDGVVAFGNPARVIRTITPADY
jgi:UDP-N-acetylbacillosamine N-acetyltransferase